MDYEKAIRKALIELKRLVEASTRKRGVCFVSVNAGIIDSVYYDYSRKETYLRLVFRNTRRMVTRDFDYLGFPGNSVYADIIEDLDDLKEFFS